MSEWLKEHAWKTIRATSTERYRNTSSRNRFNDFPPQKVARCDPVNVGVVRQLSGATYTISTQFSASLAPVRTDGSSTCINASVVRRTASQLADALWVYRVLEKRHWAAQPSSLYDCAAGKAAERGADQTTV